jgi:pimeloyl-ACP methyl ester carboxylesterase
MSSAGHLRYLERCLDSSVRPRGTLLLIHAFPLSARMFEGNLRSPGPAGASSRRTCAASAERDAPAASVDDYAGDVIDLLDTLHIDEAVIGGVSMGGYIAFAIFRTRRATFRG